MRGTGSYCIAAYAAGGGLAGRLARGLRRGPALAGRGGSMARGAGRRSGDLVPGRAEHDPAPGVRDFLTGYLSALIAPKSLAAAWLSHRTADWPAGVM